VPEYYLVKDENSAIGTVDKLYPVETRFALAGRTWETVEVNEKAKTIFVKLVPGISTVDWNVDFTAELHTVLVRKMKSILESGEEYAYLSESCRERLGEIRFLARNSGILNNLITRLSETKYAIFPWMGTRQLYTLHFLFLKFGLKSRILWRTSVYLEVDFHAGSDAADLLYKAFMGVLNTHNAEEIPLPDKIQIDNKFNEYIPLKLLKKQFVYDFLDLDGTKEIIREYFD
jgi:ATP-dependent Lhr-like helicase